MKKKLIALVTALTLCAAVVVGTTLAYYSAQTDEVANTFTYSPDTEDPDPEIDEPSFPEDPTVTPGTAVPKDPQIVLTNPNIKDDQEFYAAIIIRGSSIVNGKNSLKAILADGKYKVGTKEQIKLNTDGTKVLDAQGNPVIEIVDVIEDVGLAKIWGWSDKFTYEVNPTTGDIYAYYLTKLSKTNLRTDAVFQAVITNSEIDSILKGMKEEDLERFYDIYVQGYVVSSINDTQIKLDGTYADWGSCQNAMKAAFTDAFADGTAVTIPPYKYPISGEPTNPFI